MASATISDVYQKARHSLLVARDGIERLERLESSTIPSPARFAAPPDISNPDLAQHVREELVQLHKYSMEMEELWRSQIAKPHRDLWKRKVEQIAEEADSLEKALDKYQSRQHHRQLEAKQRAELFQRAKGDASEGAHILQVYDEDKQASQSTKNSSRILEEAHATGAAVLVKFGYQRERLKNAQRKALDILNTVGLSNSVLKLIEKQHRIDKWISYIGMLVTVIMVFGVWFWLR